MVIIGTVTGIPCQKFGLIARERLKLDDSRDVFAVQGVGGIFGKIMMGVYGAASFTTQFGALFNLGLDTVALVFTMRLDNESQSNGLESAPEVNDLAT